MSSEEGAAREEGAAKEEGAVAEAGAAAAELRLLRGKDRRLAVGDNTKGIKIVVEVISTTVKALDDRTTVVHNANYTTMLADSLKSEGVIVPTVALDVAEVETSVAENIPTSAPTATPSHTPTKV